MSRRPPVSVPAGYDPVRAFGSGTNHLATDRPWDRLSVFGAVFRGSGGPVFTVCGAVLDDGVVVMRDHAGAVTAVSLCARCRRLAHA